MTLSTLVIFMIGLWTLAFYASRVLQNDMQRLLGEQQFSTVTFIAEEINHELGDRMEQLEKVARRITPTMLDDPAALQTFLEQQWLIQESFNAGVIAYRPDGVAIANAPLSAERIGIDYSGRDYLVGAIGAGKMTLGTPHISKSKGFHEFIIATPIRDPRGKVIGALSGVTALDSTNFHDIIVGNRYGKTGDYLLLDPRHGLFVTSTDKSLALQPLPAPGSNPIFDRYRRGLDGFGIATSSLGIEQLTAAKRIPVAGWLMVAELPVEEAFAPIRAMQQRMLLATILLTLLAGILIWWLLKHHLSPLLTATGTLARLANPDHPLQPLAIVRHDEIGQLIGSFNHLIEAVRQREQALRQTQTELHEAQRIAHVGSWKLDAATNRVVWSDELYRILAWNLETPVPDYADRARLFTAESWDRLDAALLSAQKTGIPFELELEMVRTDQRHGWMRVLGEALYDDSGAIVGLQGAAQDITERKRDEEKLRLAASVFTNVSEGIAITDVAVTIIEVNEAFTRITGYSRAEVLGKNPRILKSGRQSTQFYLAMWAGLVQKGEWRGEIWNRHKNGEVYAEMLNINAVRDDHGGIQNYVALFSDITALKVQQSQLEHIAHFDALTGAPNRLLLADRLHQAMSQAARHGQKLAVAFIDLDGFKTVNDRYGHEAGDQLLIAVTSRMKQALRDGDSLARLGGDEFVALLLDLTDAAASVPILNRLLEAVAEPVRLGDIDLQVTASLGVTFYPQEDEATDDQLLHQADQAMYRAKQAGKGRYCFFDAAQDRDSPVAESPVAEP